MFKIFWSAAVGVILLTGAASLLFFMVLSTAGEAVIESENEMKSKVGTKVLYESDSVTIIDYTLWNETYRLSNGIEVSKEFVK